MLRVVVFGSYYRGFFVLNELLFGPLASRVKVTGVATDDPSAPFINASRRVWQYPHTHEEEVMIKELCWREKLPFYDQKVKSEDFYSIFEQNWKPDVCIMATFGQRINERMFRYPKYGFYNLHPSDDAAWPSRYAGCNPFQHMLQDRAGHCVISMHHVDDGFDTGERVAVSEKIYIPPDASVPDLHKVSSPIAALLVRSEIAKILDSPERAGRAGERLAAQ